MFSSSYCSIRFYYYIYGKSAGSLTIYYRTAIGGPFIPLWTKSGPISQNWEKAEATFNYLNTNLQIIIDDYYKIRKWPSSVRFIEFADEQLKGR
jgi:hypothetical protein